MKTLKPKFSSRLIAKILTLCGISLTCTACYVGPMHMEYLNLDGVVVADETGKPIEGIQVTFKGSTFNTVYQGEEYYYRGTESALTGDNGTYVIEHVSDYTTMTITAEDIDGVENGGEFETQTVPFDIKNAERIVIEDDYDTVYEIRKTLDFQLKLKTEDTSSEESEE